MEYLVIADFKVNEGMAEDMANVFKEALLDTRAFEGCNGIDVYFEEKTNTFTLIEDWTTLENYETIPLAKDTSNVFLKYTNQ